MLGEQRYSNTKLNKVNIVSAPLLCGFLAASGALWQADESTFQSIHCLMLLLVSSSRDAIGFGAMVPGRGNVSSQPSNRESNILSQRERELPNPSVSSRRTDFRSPPQISECKMLSRSNGNGQVYSRLNSGELQNH